MYVRKFMWTLLAGWLLCVPLAHSQTSFRVNTIPSADVTLSFTQPGRLIELHFAEGATVKSGDLIAKQDDTLEQARLAQAIAKAEDTTQIKASEASLEQKRVDLKKIEIAAQHNAVAPLEVEHAQLNVKIAELSLELAQFEHKLTLYTQKEVQILVNRMQLICPVDGRVEEVFVEKGESVNALQEVVRIVQIDPLWIDAKLPTHVATNLKPDDRINVRFPNSSNTQPARIIHVASVADSGSETMRVRLEVPNKSKRPAGENVDIFLSATQDQ